jgi:uncharacterized protein YdcH (DUF465 family)
VTWQVDASYLDRIADRVNKMDHMLYSLRNMQGEVGPAQAKTIARLAPQVVVLTDEVNSSVRFLNNNHQDLWSPTWRIDTDEMHNTSHILTSDLRSAKG